MLKIHHLNMSRSERIVWLAEELGLEYELVHHTRDPQTFRSPPSLFAVRHLANGTSFPAIETGAPIEGYPNVVAYLKRVEARPAYRKMGELCP